MKPCALLILLLIGTFFGVDGINILSATHQRKLVDSLTSRFELGIYEIDFDEPLSIMESYGHCDLTCTAPDAIPNECPFCDYSDPDICAGIRVNDTLCPCPISAACNLPFLSSNSSLTSVVNPERSQYYAFVIDATASCDMFLLELLAYNGDLELAITTAANFDKDGDSAFGLEVTLQSFQRNPDSILLCPGSFLEYAGTYVVRVSGTGKTWRGTEYSLLLRNRLLPIDTSPEPSTCTAATARHICLQDDQPLSMPMPDDPNESLFFSFKLPVQCPVTVSLFADRPFILSVTNPFPEFRTDGADPRTLILELTPRERTVQSFCVNEEDTYLYIGVPGLVVSPDGAPTQLKLSVSTNPGWIFTRPVSEYPPRALTYAFSGTSFVTTPKERLMCDSFDFYENGCDGYWHLFSGREVNPLIPSPPRIIKDNIANLQNASLSPLASHKYAVAVVLSSKLFDQHGFRRITVEEFERGTMHFMGRITDAQGKPIILKTTFVPKQLPACNYRPFHEHHLRVAGILNQLADFKDELVVNSMRLELNGIIAYDSYMACQSFASGLFETKTMPETALTDRCIVSWHAVLNHISFEFVSGTNDWGVRFDCWPSRLQTCLNSDRKSLARFLNVKHIVVGRYRSMFDEKTFGSVVLRLFFKDDPAFDEDPCCMQPSFWYWSGFWEIPENNNTLVCVPQNVTFDTSSLVAISSNTIRDQCFAAPCVMNLAEKYFQVSARQNHPIVGCDSNFINFDTFRDLLYKGQLCENSYAEFLEQAWCTLNNTHPSVLDRLGPRLNISIDTTVGRDEILMQWRYALTYVSCSVGGLIWDRFDIKEGSSEACQFYGCNWAPINTLQDSYENANEKCTTTAPTAEFCAVCDDSLYYCQESQDIFVPELCSGFRCQLPNGTSMAVEDPEQQCQNMGFCSAPCYNGEVPGDCANESACLLAGNCNDHYFDDVIGKCIDTSSEEFSCGPSQYDNATAREFIVGIGCYEPLATDETQCLTEVPGGRWVTRAHTEQVCIDQNRVRCYTDDTNYLSNMTTSQCRAFGGDPSYYVFGLIFQWADASWGYGVPTALEWKARGLELVSGKAQVTWDLPRFGLYAVNVISDLYSIERSSSAKCRTGQASELINAIACTCAADGERSNACFEQYNPSAALSQQVICRGVLNEIFLIHADVSIDTNDLTVDSAVCTLLQNSIISASEFEVMTTDELSNFFLKFNRNTARSIKNSNNATIGKIASDGLAFDFNDNSVIMRALICIEGDVQDIDMTKYPIADVGRGDWKSKSIEPLDLPVTWNGTHYCAVIYNVTDGDTSLNTNIYFFVQRIDGWQEKLPQMEFSDAELGLIITLIICYAFTFGFSVFRIIDMIRYGFLAQIKILIYVFLAALFFVRLLYFVLLAANVFVLESRGDYVLIELPSFLYFSTLSVYVIVWAVSMRSTLDVGKDTKKLLHRVTLSVNAAIYLIFIVLIILYETLRPAPLVECNGLLITYDITTSAGIALAYRLFVTSISFALMICFAVYGIKATRLMARNSQIKSKNEAKNKTMQTTAISATGLLVQCVYLFLLLVVNFQNNILSLVVLLVVEIGVGITLLVLTTVRKQSSGTSQTKMQSKLGGSNTRNSAGQSSGGSSKL